MQSQSDRPPGMKSTDTEKQPWVPGALSGAILSADVQEVKRLIKKHESRMDKIMIDDVDCKGRISLMTASRVNGWNGPGDRKDFQEILKILWDAYKNIKVDLKPVLFAVDDKCKWNILMHSARNNDKDMFEIVLGFYKELITNGTITWKEIQDGIDWGYVGNDIKSALATEVFQRTEIEDTVAAGDNGKSSKRRSVRQKNHDTSNFNFGLIDDTFNRKRRAVSLPPRPKAVDLKNSSPTTDPNVPRGKKVKTSRRPVEKNNPTSLSASKQKNVSSPPPADSRPTTEGNQKNDNTPLNKECMSEITQTTEVSGIVPGTIYRDAQWDPERDGDVGDVMRKLEKIRRERDELSATLEQMRKERDAAIQEVHKCRNAIRALVEN